MKQTIEIEVPDGKVAVWEDGKVVFKDAKPLLPKTWLEFVETQNYDKSQIITRVPQDITLRHIALIQLHQLRDCYRCGWVPDWTDDCAKWCIECSGNKIEVTYYYSASHILSFQSPRLANEFLNNFRDLIEQAGDLI